MEIVFFSHPDFLDSQSMPRFSKMLANGMEQRGHSIKMWSPQPCTIRFSPHKKLKKWLGYIDQYIIFPAKIKRLVKKSNQNTLFVFTDHALGPWVPLVSNLPHVIHCHDFLAQRSALGEIAENVTGYTGKKYQEYIRNGYTKGKNFISVSQKTKEDLHRFVGAVPARSEMVYNGLNGAFKPLDSLLANDAVNAFGGKLGIDFSNGFILHVGGNQWYKNRIGVIEIYDAWRAKSELKIPLLLIGSSPSDDLLKRYNESLFKADIHFKTGMNDEDVKLAYGTAAVLLFPSLAEGFGWPIAEAMASGCLVITTNEAPMTEVAGNAGFLINRRPNDPLKSSTWASESAAVMEHVIMLEDEQRKAAVEKGIQSVKRFDSAQSLDQIEIIYKNILQAG